MSQRMHRRSFLGLATSTLLFGTASALSAEQPEARRSRGPVLRKPEKNMANIRHALLIGAAAEKVYGAIASQEGLSAWWTPDVKAKPERGSIARFSFGPDYFKEMRIVELEPAKRVEWLCVTGVDEWVGTTLAFDIQSGDRKTMLDAHPEMEDQIEQQGNRDTQTLLTLSHDDWRGHTPMFAECNYTWGQFLRSLKLFCETGKGRPWPRQHRTDA